MEEALKKLAGKKVLVTAGPTYEPIDPVRFIGNRSSGKMGYALADALARYGAEVILISGPVHVKPKEDKVCLIRVETAAQMLDVCAENFDLVDVGIFAAAVADYTPKQVSDEKIKKQGDTLTLELVKTRDILLEMSRRKKVSQVLVGFALETENELENAKDKLQRKQLDMIVLNSLRDAGAGFATDTNRISIVDKYNNILTFELKHKDAVALDILHYLTRFLHV